MRIELTTSGVEGGGQAHATLYHTGSDLLSWYILLKLWTLPINFQVRSLFWESTASSTRQKKNVSAVVIFCFSFRRVWFVKLAYLTFLYYCKITRLLSLISSYKLLKILTAIAFVKIYLRIRNDKYTQSKLGVYLKTWNNGQLTNKNRICRFSDDL